MNKPMRTIDRTNQYDEAWMNVNAIFQNGMTSTGKVTGIETIDDKNRAVPCLTVLVEGSIKGIIPAQEIDEGMEMKDSIKFQRYMRNLVGNNVPFKILKVDRRDEPGVCILSRKRALVEIRKATWEAVNEGDVVDAQVTDVLSHNARLEIGGVEVTLHATEVAHGWIGDVRDHLRVGDEIEVKVIKVDLEKKQLHVSRKVTLSDLWEDVSDMFKVGNEYLGTITGIKDYGVFVNLKDNVDALLPLPSSAIVRKKMDVGQEALIKVLKINTDKRQIQGRILKIIL